MQEPIPLLRTYKEQNTGRLKPRGKHSARSRPRAPAVRLIGPFAVEADHAELNADTDADHAAVLGDRVVHRAPHAIGDHGGRLAEPARDCARRPWLPGHFLDPLEAGDLQVGIPEL